MNVHQTPQIPLLDLDLLKTLVAISETGNFSEAAKVVFRTPSAISMQVKKVEELLGRPVFIREARSVSLNEDGKTLVTHARRVLALNRDIISQFITPDVCGTVRLGAIDHAVDQFLPSVLCRFNDTHPGITVDVTVENSKILIEKLQTGELDAAIISCNSHNSAKFETELLFEEEIVWAGKQGGIAAEQNPVPVSVWEEGCVWRRLALEGLEKHGIDYRITFKSAQIAGQKAGLAADLAIAPLPRSSCGGDIVELDSKFGLPELGYYALGLIVKPDVGAATQAVADSFRAVFGKLN